MSRSLAVISIPMSFVLAIAVAGALSAGGGRDCGSCHLPPEGGSARRGSAVCVACHDAASLDGRGQGEAGRSVAAGALTGHVLEEAASRRVVGVGGGDDLEDFGCLTCHTAHDNGRPFQLRELEKRDATGPGGEKLDAVSRFCLGCHPQFAETRGFGGHYVRHPIGLPVPRMRRDADAAELLPLADVRRTESEKDDVIACWTCHVTHASPNAFLLRYRDDQQIEVCTTCHEIDGPPAG